MPATPPPPIGNWTPTDYQAFWWLVWKVSVLPILMLLGGILLALGGLLFALWRLGK